MKKLEVAKWLERMPLAPEFRPTDTEFSDPIAYISKIEKEASAFGICKVIPPLPKPSRKYVLNNLNKSLLKCPELGSDINGVVSSKTDTDAGENCNRSGDDVESRAVFTTRSQELGFEKVKKMKGMTKESVPGGQKHVWQSGEVYTLEQFEAKSKIFAKSQLGMVKDVNPLVIETMFWKATTEKPIYVEYANDVPGSGFGQPEGSLHHFHKRRRRRKRNSYDRNNSSNASIKNESVSTVSISSSKADKDSGQKNNSYICTETTSSSLSPPRKDSNPSVEVEGSAGWKLSNSPWNLQVIARSPGSLTKFMPDDIPGVTSPMVYVGMLFSWFAWHVEDHELHSLNYLHMGSPKTWYSVPGDRAFDFEETIRQSAYGGVTDRSVALSLLGEKTTVLSPEAIVASGIPCCRLVQNPGEFVVTFPRAYHIGFSHGFNCGEAANFATPNWLTVAKEAAVRRAAMNYLPMLSHQQLLSILTMSFISRIPRSLLPGVRSSRLRDRQKEEREFLVKRAFIEDILHENNILTVLKRSFSYRSVLWDVESLPSSSKESELCDDTDASVLTSIEKSSSDNVDSVDHDHISQLDEYIGAVGFDLNDDDLAYDFQMDSGTLPCVACGILGFPFMAVVQPSQAASKNLLPENPLTVSVESHILDGSNNVAEASFEELGQSPVGDHSSSIKCGSGFPNVDIDKDWSVANIFLKPRIFCLKHALEIEQLLRPTGGANVLVICHSDFQKIKTHVASIAEEASIPFHFNEISLTNASQEDLHLIDIAIDRDEQTNCADWTGKLNVNLQHYLNVKRSSPNKNVQYALTLVGLICDGAASMADASSVKWLSRKFRSNRQLKHLSQSKPSAGVESIEELLETTVGFEVATNDMELIQYSRKRYKSSRSAGKEAITDTNDDECKELDTEDKRLDEFNFTIGSNEDTQKYRYENTGTPSHENVGVSNAESQSLTEGETVDDDENEVPHTVQPDGDDVKKEVSGPLCPSTSLDGNFQPRHEVETSERPTSVINESFSDPIEESSNDNGTVLKDREINSKKSVNPKFASVSKNGNKRKREATPQNENQLHAVNFVKSPCEGLRPRGKIVNERPTEETPSIMKLKKASNESVLVKEHRKGRYKCDLDGCCMSFQLKTELVLHKGNRCPVDGCRKKFSTHKYTIQHHRVHDDDRPLKCPWTGCTMSFKWAWARTEHIRVHTGERPYSCKIKGCGLTFRYVSDFSRHRRKTGHYVKTVT